MTDPKPRYTSTLLEIRCGNQILYRRNEGRIDREEFNRRLRLGLEAHLGQQAESPVDGGGAEEDSTGQEPRSTDPSGNS